MPACDRTPFLRSRCCRDECTRTTSPLDNDVVRIIARIAVRWDRLIGWHTIGYHVPKVTNLHQPGKFFVTTRTAVPGTVRAAGVLVTIEGLAGVVFAIVLLVAGSSGPGRNIYGEAGYFTVIFGGVLACGIGLLLGKRWSRGPSTAVQILLLGVAWYAIGPSGQPLLGAPVAVACIAVLVLLFRASSRAWAEGHVEEDVK